MSRQVLMCLWQSQDSRIQAMWWHCHGLKSEWVLPARKISLDTITDVSPVLVTWEWPEEWAYFFLDNMLLQNHLIPDKDMSTRLFSVQNKKGLLAFYKVLPTMKLILNYIKGVTHVVCVTTHTVHPSLQPSRCDRTHS